MKRFIAAIILAASILFGAAQPASATTWTQRSTSSYWTQVRSSTTSQAQACANATYAVAVARFGGTQSQYAITSLQPTSPTTYSWQAVRIGTGTVFGGTCRGA